MQWLHFLRVSLQNVPSGVLDSTKQLACFLKRQYNAILDGCGSSESQKELERETGGDTELDASKNIARVRNCDHVGIYQEGMRLVTKLLIGHCGWQ